MIRIQLLFTGAKQSNLKLGDEVNLELLDIEKSGKTKES